MTGQLRHPGQDRQETERQNRTGRIEQAKQDRLNRKGRIGQAN
jgi:hypothetical protein